jgi:hypothetical protein
MADHFHFLFFLGDYFGDDSIGRSDGLHGLLLRGKWSGTKQ